MVVLVGERPLVPGTIHRPWRRERERDRERESLPVSILPLRTVLESRHPPILGTSTPTI